MGILTDKAGKGLSMLSVLKYNSEADYVALGVVVTSLSGHLPVPHMSYAILVVFPWRNMPACGMPLKSDCPLCILKFLLTIQETLENDTQAEAQAAYEAYSPEEQLALWEAYYTAQVSREDGQDDGELILIR